MPDVFCVAYGSNLHPVRLRERVASARAVGVVELPGYALAFHKRGGDGSGKCLLYEAGGDALAYGVLYGLAAADKPALDRFEGLGVGYGEHALTVRLEGREHRAYLYMALPSHVAPAARPFHWYKQLVLAGARHHRLPQPYIAAIAAVPSIDDPDAHRARTHDALLARCRGA